MTTGKSKQWKPWRKKIHLGYGDDGDIDDKADVKGSNGNDDEDDDVDQKVTAHNTCTAQLTLATDP